MSQTRKFTKDFKLAVVERILNGESVSALHHELKIKRSILYRWRDAYRAEGEAGLSRPRGRPPGGARLARTTTKTGSQADAKRIAELERKVGQQALEIDFLARAFKRVNEDRQRNTEAGGPASTEKSEK
ncbi:MAG: helix-turn-helix domain-containing protein [Acidobacteria bacterium]|nr:MAG: helix-turn-helix domain-containing protein [Acidobacteriota bacterium]